MSCVALVTCFVSLGSEILKRIHWRYWDIACERSDSCDIVVFWYGSVGMGGWWNKLEETRKMVTWEVIVVYIPSQRRCTTS